MKTAFVESSVRARGAALALATALAIGGIFGCGGAGGRGGDGAVTAKADAVEVTYYYLPG
jgi:ABC-type glycerol-3-phosphate transport system substrate-binding protein